MSYVGAVSGGSESPGSYRGEATVVKVSLPPTGSSYSDCAVV